MLNVRADVVESLIAAIYLDGGLEAARGFILANWQGRAARAEGAPALYLCVWEKGDRAIAFYRKHGFETVGETPFMLGNLRYMDPVMRLSL